MIVPVGDSSRIILSSNLDPVVGIGSLPDDHVSLVFTSPPYWDYKDYGENVGVSEQVGKEDLYDGYLQNLENLFFLIFQKTMPGGRLVINISNMKSRKSEGLGAFLRPVSHDVARVLCSVGFTFFDEIVWSKREGGPNGTLGGKPLFGSYPYPPSLKIMDSVFENIYIFIKEGKRRYPPKAEKEKSRISTDEWREWTNGVWRIYPDKSKGHPAMFPMELAMRVVRMYSFVGDVVLDPFAGSGTAVVAAERFGRVGIGYEIDPGYKGVIEARVARVAGV